MYLDATQLLAYLDTVSSAEARSDDGTAGADTTIATAIAATAEDTVNGILGLVASLDPAPAYAKASALAFAIEACYGRRGYTKENNPGYELANFWRTRLAKIADGTSGVAAPGDSTTAAASGAWGSGERRAVRSGS